MSVTHLERLNASRSESDHAVLCRHASSKPISRDRTRSSLKHKTAQLHPLSPGSAAARSRRRCGAGGPGADAELIGVGSLGHDDFHFGVEAAEPRADDHRLECAARNQQQLDVPGSATRRPRPTRNDYSAVTVADERDGSDRRFTAQIRYRPDRPFPDKIGRFRIRSAVTARRGTASTRRAPTRGAHRTRAAAAATA